MPRKKRSKTKRKKKWKGFGDFFSASGQILLKGFPLFAGLVFTVMIFAGMRELLYADSGLTVQKIQVSPTTGLSVQQREKLEARWVGKNILRVPLKEIARELEKDPVIAEARVSRRLPYSLAIEIKQRTPMAFIQFRSRGKYGVISDDGMILDVVPSPSSGGLVVDATTLSQKKPLLGRQIQERSFLEAVKFLEAFAAHPLGEQESVQKITLNRNGNVTLHFRGRPPIHLGRRPATRVAALEKMIPLLDRENQKKIEYVDLQFDNVIVKRKK